MLNINEFGVVKLNDGGLTYLPSKRAYSLSSLFVSLLRLSR
tara:strand:- start:61 stop:183 length:123 start_codon:yes stop_codon:yes gene_type:complete